MNPNLTQQNRNHKLSNLVSVTFTSNTKWAHKFAYNATNYIFYTYVLQINNQSSHYHPKAKLKHRK